jgi:hypothetical protein
MRTYKSNRKCLQCGAAIADQEHGLQKFCAKQTLVDGSIKNCKDDYWSQLRKEEMTPYLKIAYFNRDQTERTALLYNTKGEKVLVEDLNQYGINLNRPVEFKLEKNKYTFYFHQYAIEQLPDNYFKIFTHELH